MLLLNAAPVQTVAKIAFTPIDIAAVVIGVICGAYACWRQKSLDGDVFLLGFAPGTSTVYFAGLAIFMWFSNLDTFDQMIHSNIVLLCGSFIVGVVMNIKTLSKL